MPEILQAITAHDLGFVTIVVTLFVWFDYRCEKRIRNAVKQIKESQ